MGYEKIKYLRIFWQKDLGCDLSGEEWLKIISNTKEYINEAWGKYTQYKLKRLLAPPTTF